MFELHVSNRNVDSGSVSVGWCVSRDTLEALYAAGNKDPQVVLLLSRAGDQYAREREVRKVVPLSDLVAYLEFVCPGEMKIWGFIANEVLSISGIKDHWLSSSDGAFDRSILAYTGEEYRANKLDTYLVEKAKPISVSIPEQAFAAPPAKWEKRWVNHFFDSKPRNQCQFRRRRLFGYT